MLKVDVNYAEERGYSSSIPEPVIEILEIPKRIKFVIKGDGKTIELSSVIQLSKHNSENIIAEMVFIDQL